VIPPDSRQLAGPAGIADASLQISKDMVVDGYDEGFDGQVLRLVHHDLEV
jgi:hypothetical protein